MALHLLKLCVGAQSIADLEAWIEQRHKNAKTHSHITRMVPKRVEELLDGGSLYWVIKGQIAARQKLAAINTFTDKEGVGRCRLVLEKPVVAVHPRPFRAFQGWRYLQDKDAPADLAQTKGGADIAQMPEDMRRHLRDLGLL